MNMEKTKELKEVMTKKDQFKNLKGEIDNQRKAILSNTIGEFNIDEILDQYTEEEIENMSFETMKATFVNNEGDFIFNEKDLSQDLIQDFIKYLKLSKITYDKMDKEFDKLDKYLKDFNEEIKTISGNTSFNKMLKANIEDAMKEEISDAEQKRYELILKALDDASTLKPLFDLYETISPENTVKELKNESKRIAVLKQYVDLCKKHKLEPHLLKFGEFERILEDTKYEEHKNLFVFIVARYIKYLGEKVSEVYYRTLVVQLINYMREMIMGEDNELYQADKEEIQILKNNIKLLLDKFYN